MTIRPRATAMDGKRYTMPYQWVIEGDIKGCFDHIDHHALMQRIRHRVADRRVNRLVVQFLKAGVLMEEQFIQTPTGTPQGGILSPLLANIALSAIEERYERWVHHRSMSPALIFSQASSLPKPIYKVINGPNLYQVIRIAVTYLNFICDNSHE